MDSGQPTEALAAAERAVALDAKSATARNVLSGVLRAMGEWKRIQEEREREGGGGP